MVGFRHNIYRCDSGLKMSIIQTEVWKRNPTRVTDSQIFQFAYIYNGSIGSGRCVVSLSFLYSVLRGNTSSVFCL
jgi:hypothetical protein